jgi:hypothetical protein
MGNTLTLAYNKVQYMVAKNLSDPEADNFAKQQAAQAAQDKVVADRKKAADAKNKKTEEQKKAENEAAMELQRKSQFSTPKDFAAKVSDKVIAVFKSLLFIALSLYGGYISSNKAIGYNVPFRLLSFIYGSLLWFIVIPLALIDIYYRKKVLPNYAFLPLSTHVPSNKFENFFIGAFCYKEDAASIAAKAEVMSQYESAFSGVKATAAVATAAVAAAVVGASVAKPAAQVPSPGTPVASPAATPVATPVPSPVATPIPSAPGTPLVTPVASPAAQKPGTTVATPAGTPAPMPAKPSAKPGTPPATPAAKPAAMPVKPAAMPAKPSGSKPK